MKHHCHCGLEKHLEHFRVKRFGVVGIVLMVAHILFHVAECVVLPAVLVGLGGHVVEEQAVAANESILNVPVEEEINAQHHTSNLKLVDFQQSLSLWDLRLEF